jgi:hypothetical protein
MKRSRGVAAPFAEAYGPVDPALKFKVGDIHEQQKEDGTTLLNVVHKDKYFHKFGYDPNAFLGNIVHCLVRLKEYCVERGIERLALVRIASNTEKVHWRWTQMKLLEIFADVKITLAIYLQKPPRRVFHKTNSSPEEAVAAPSQTNAVLEKVAERLAEEVDKGNVGGGSLLKLPSPKRKPPRHFLPEKVISVGQGTTNANPRSSLRKTTQVERRTNEAPRNAAISNQANSAKGAIKKVKKDVLPKRLSGGGGTTTPSPPSSEPPLTNLPSQVMTGGKDGAGVPNALFPSMAVASDLAEAIRMLRDDMAKISTDVAELRRSMTPGRTRRLTDVPISPASCFNVSQRSSRQLSTDAKNKQLQAPTKAQ